MDEKRGMSVKYRSRRTGEVYTEPINAMAEMCRLGVPCAECPLEAMRRGGTCAQAILAEPEKAAFVMGLEPIEYRLSDRTRDVMRLLGARWVSRDERKVKRNARFVELWSEIPLKNGLGIYINARADRHDAGREAAIRAELCPEVEPGEVVEIDEAEVLELGVKG